MSEEHHYFASCAFGWATNTSREKAITELLKCFRKEATEITKNTRKTGCPGFYFWSCRIDAPNSTEYEINFYCPQGVPVRDTKHHHVTYITTKDVAWMTSKSGEYDKHTGKL